MSKIVRKRKPEQPPATVLHSLLEKFFEYRRERNYSEETLSTERYQLNHFLVWCGERGIT